MLPQFLCIGAQKAGTTWLFQNLRPHPQVRLPPVKEIHYFDRGHYRNAPLGQRLRERRWRRQIGTQLRSAVRHASLPRLAWTLRYFFGARNDRWYGALFQVPPNGITGDITPAYSILTDAQVREAATLLPEARIILLLRDPIERAYSHARMDIASGNFERDRFQRDLGKLTPEDYARFFALPHVRARGNYPHMVQTWRAHFGDEHVFIGYLDDIKRQPQQFLLDVFAFLGIEASARHVRDTAERAVLTGVKAELPPAVGQHLAGLYLPDLDTLTALLPEPGVRHVRAWREHALRLLET